MKPRHQVLGLLAVAIVLSACAPVNTFVGKVDAGYWTGLLHGLVSPFALIGSFFTDVGFYQAMNSGPWYDVGFFTGIAFIVGGSGAASEGGVLVVIFFGAICVTALRGAIDLFFLAAAYLSQ